MTTTVGARKNISWARGLPNISPVLSRTSKLAKAKQALETKSLREVLTQQPVLKKVLKKTGKRAGMRKEDNLTLKHDSTKFVYGNQKPSIRATMALSNDGRCGLTAGKLGQKAGCDILKDYRPGQYIEQIIKTTKAKAKEVEKIKKSHKSVSKRASKVDEESVKKRIIDGIKRK